MGRRYVGPWKSLWFITTKIGTINPWGTELSTRCFRFFQWTVTFAVANGSADCFDIITERQPKIVDMSFWTLQGKRIEALSKVEHDLIKEVHPQVGEIKEGMEAIIAVVNDNPPSLTTKK